MVCVCVCACLNFCHYFFDFANGFIYGLTVFVYYWFPGGGPLYKLYGYVPPLRVGFVGSFGLKTGIDLPILARNRVWFTKELRLCVNVFVVSIPNV